PIVVIPSEARDLGSSRGWQKPRFFVAYAPRNDWKSCLVAPADVARYVSTGCLYGAQFFTRTQIAVQRGDWFNRCDRRGRDCSYCISRLPVVFPDQPGNRSPSRRDTFSLA